MPNAITLITDLRAADVLLGRGSGPNDHEGNVRFRHLVQERKDEYLATNHRQTKGLIAQGIVDLVRAGGGRFLRKLEPPEAAARGLPDGTEAWVAVDEDTVMEKAKQALRQNTQKQKALEMMPPPPPRQQQSLSPVPAGAGGHLALQEVTPDMEPIPLGPPRQISVMTAPQGATSFQIPQGQLLNPQTHAVSAGTSGPTWYTNGQPQEITGSWQGAESVITVPTGQQQAWPPGDEGVAPPATGNALSRPEEEYDPDSMLAYLRPPAVISTYTSGPGHEAGLQQYSPYFSASRGGSRRGSITMNELVQRRFSNMSCESNMSDIMDSVSKMSVTDIDPQILQRRRQSISTDTIGTIEDIGGGNDDMSFATVDTSAFSVGINKNKSPENAPQAAPIGSAGSSSSHKKWLPDRNAPSAMSGNLSSMSAPPNVIRTDMGPQSNGRRTSIDMLATANHDILEGAEYVYHLPGNGTAGPAPAGGGGGAVAAAAARPAAPPVAAGDMPTPAEYLKAPSNAHALEDLGASSLSFKSPFVSAADLDMNSALFDALVEGDYNNTSTER